MICGLCGVKVTTCQARRQRFGHITLPIAISHPLGDGGEHLSAVPILPAAFWQTSTGSQLAKEYDELARDAVSGTERLLVEGVTRVFELLLPVVILAHEWNLMEANILAQGLAIANCEDADCRH